MKFGKLFEEELKQSNIPEEWIENGSIHYKQLKKTLSKLVRELDSIGVLNEIQKLRVSYTVSQNNSHNTLHPVLNMNISDVDKSLDQLLGKLDELGYTYSLKPISGPVIELPMKKVVVANREPESDDTTNNRNSIIKEDVKIETKEIESIDDERENQYDSDDVRTIDARHHNGVSQLKQHTKERIETNGREDEDNEIESLDVQIRNLGRLEYDDNDIESRSEGVNSVNGYSYEVSSQFTNDTDKVYDGDIEEDNEDEDINVETEDSEILLLMSEETEDKFNATLKWYELSILLHEDAKFFDTLKEEIKLFENLKDTEKQGSINKIEEVSQLISTTVSPSARKSDMYIWRQIFQLYIESEIFFTLQNSTRSGVKLSVNKVEEINKKYVSFLQKINEMKLVESFNKKTSIKGYLEFKMINENLIKLLIFENLNNLAIYKILKKFNKQTVVLNTDSKFQDLLINQKLIDKSPGHNISPFIVKDLCSILTMRLLNITPQVDDYTCPICSQVAFKPIRLSCGHLFCVRCLVKLQRQNKDACPLCRNLTVLDADETNLDKNTLDFIKLYFPKEIKLKKEDDEKEIFKEQFGEIIDVEKKCVIV